MSSPKCLARRGAFITARLVIAILGGFSAATSEATVEADPTFHFSDDPRVQGVYWCHVLPDGKILAGGFNAFRLNADGSLDTTYPVISTPSSFLIKPAMEPGGGFTAYGNFYDYAQGGVRPFIQRYGPAGTPDASFLPALSQFRSVNLLRRDDAGRYLVAGELIGAGAQGMLRLLADGSVDASFSPLLNFSVAALAPTGGGNWVVLGSRESDLMLRINDSGAVLSEVAIVLGPYSSISPRPIVPLANGGVLFGAEYPMVGTLRRDGTDDPAFYSVWGEGPSDPAVSSMVRLANGRIVVGAYRTGSYLAHTPVWPLPESESSWPGRRLFRLLPDGMLDLSFDAIPAIADSFYVTDLVVQPDGKFLTSDSQGVHRYVETPSLPVFSFRVKTETVNETAWFAAITIYRGGDVRNRGSVMFSTVASESSATAWREYWPLRVRIPFDRGDWKRTVFVPLRDDSVADGTKNIVVRLSQPDSGSQLYSVTDAKIEILDNEE